MDKSEKVDTSPRFQLFEFEFEFYLNNHVKQGNVILFYLLTEGGIVSHID